MKVGVLCSSGGSSLISALEMFERVYPGEVKLVGVVDRSCGFLSYCRDADIPVTQIDCDSRVQMSREARDFFQKEKVDFVFLFFLRLVDEVLHRSIPTINFHPSFLPAFKGFNAIRQALEGGSRYLGASAHLVNDEVDGGEIIAQTVAPITPAIDQKEAERISYIQKALLVLTLLEKLRDEDLRMDFVSRPASLIVHPAVARGDFLSSPLLETSDLRKEFKRFISDLEFSESVRDSFRAVL